MKKVLIAIAAILAAAFAQASPPVVDTTNSVVISSGTNGLTSASTSVTIGASDNLLVVKVWLEYQGAVTDPTTITYNGVALTKLGSNNGTTNVSGYAAYYYMVNPPVGTATLALTFTADFLYIVFAEPMSGVNTSSPFGTLVWGVDNTGSGVSSISATATGAGANDIYSGWGYLERVDTANNNANMVNISTATPGDKGSSDYILGTHAGLISYIATTGGSQRIGIAGSVAIFGQNVWAGAATDAITAAGALTTGAPAPFAQILLDDPAHVNGSDQISMGSGPGTGSGDTANTAFMKLKQWAVDQNVMTAHMFPVRSIQTPVTGFTIVAAIGVTQLVLNPAGTLAAGTVTFPFNPADNQPFVLMSSQTITALTVNTSDTTTINGGPTTLSANTSVRFRFMASLNKWFREQ